MNIANIPTELNFNLKNFNTFRINSIADIAYFPNTVEEFFFLARTLEDFQIIGGASNIIFSTFGVSTPLIFTQNLNDITFESDILKVQAGVKSPNLSQFALKNSLTGFEFLISIPSSVGGNIFMNASAHNQAISDNLISVKVFDCEKSEILVLGKNECGFNYRTSIFKENPKRYMILEAQFKTIKDSQEIIQKRMDEILLKRKQTQPTLKFPNAGSIFKNPENKSAGQLLDECSMKAVQIGGAKVYENHANFIINFDNATSTDILSLMLKMKECVYNKFNINLETEVLFIGNKTENEENLWAKITK